MIAHPYTLLTLMVLLLLPSLASLKELDSPKNAEHSSPTSSDADTEAAKKPTPSPDLHEAKRLYRKAIGYLQQVPSVQNLSYAMADLQKSKALGLVLAQVKFDQLKQSLRHDPSYKARYRAALKDAKTGDAAAQLSLAQMCEFGIGVRPDVQRAIRWYKQAAEQEQGFAYARLGYLYSEGLLKDDASLSSEHASNWIKAAAEHGDIQAQLKMAEYHQKQFERDRSEQTAEQAFLWFEQAAKAGNPYAQMQTAYRLKAGQGVKQNYEQALYWFEQAQAQSHPEAEEEVKALNVLLDDLFLQNLE